MIKVGSTLKHKENGKQYRVKEIGQRCVTIEGCSIGYPCLDRNPDTGVTGCSHFIRSPRKWQDEYELVN